MNSDPKPKQINDGGKTNYYEVPANKATGSVDVDDIAEYLDLHGFLFNVTKSVFGCAITNLKGTTRHGGTSALRDANKMVHYANKYRDMLMKGENVPSANHDPEELENLAHENKNFARYLEPILGLEVVSNIANGSYFEEE